jgi:prophage regulatory protein
MPANDNYPLVSLNDVVKMTSLSRTAINIKRARGEFPVAVALGAKRVAFVRQEVVDWIDQRIAARDQREAA